MKTKEYIGNCVGNPFERIELLVEVIENATAISKKKFLQNCIVHEDILAEMKRFPRDFTFHEYKDIMFYTNSAIEHFFKKIS